MIETVDKDHVNRRHMVTADQPIQHVGKVVFILVNLPVEQDQRPTRGLCTTRLVNHHFTRVAQYFAGKCVSCERTVSQRLCGSLSRAVAHGTEIQQRIAIPAIGFLIAKGLRVKRIGLRADQNGTALIARATFDTRDIWREFVLHQRICRHNVAAEPDVGFPQTEQRIVIACGRAENKYVIARTTP